MSIDQELVKRVQAGDKKAFDLLIMKYQQRIIHVITGFVHDPVEAMDVAQEAFIKAYRALPGFRGDSAFYTWLYRIAINTSKNYLTASSRRPPLSDVENGRAARRGHSLRVSHGSAHKLDLHRTPLRRQRRLAHQGNGGF